MDFQVKYWVPQTHETDCTASITLSYYRCIDVFVDYVISFVALLMGNVQLAVFARTLSIFEAVLLSVLKIVAV